MRVLILFERSGIVREEFRNRGHDAWSCDASPSEDGSPYHVQMVVSFESLLDIGVQVNEQIAETVFYHGLNVSTYTPWDLVIAHPDCTHLSVSGAHRFAAKRADGRQAKAIHAFKRVTEIKTKRLCVENPVCIMSTLWRKPDQIIQPYQFGDDASKKTCIWLEGLPKLIIDPAQYVPPRYVCIGCGNHSKFGIQMAGCRNCGSHTSRPRWANQTDSGQNRLGPSDHRAMDRARTYPGHARAFAAQWGCL